MIGNRTRQSRQKQTAPPFKEAIFDIIYGEGISKEGTLLELATDLDIIEKSGSWYSYKDERLGQGQNNAREWLQEHPEEMAEIEHKIRVHYNLEFDDDAPVEEPKRMTSRVRKTKPKRTTSRPLDELLNLDD